MSSQSIVTVLKPAGLEKSKGLITATFGKDVNDPRWKDDPGVKKWRQFTDKSLSPTEFADSNAGDAFGQAATMVQAASKQCGSRPLPRQHHETGGQSRGRRVAAAASVGDQDQHLAGRTTVRSARCSSRHDQWRKLGAGSGTSSNVTLNRARQNSSAGCLLLPLVWSLGRQFSSVPLSEVLTRAPSRLFIAFLDYALTRLASTRLCGKSGQAR